MGEGESDTLPRFYQSPFFRERTWNMEIDLKRGYWDSLAVAQFNVWRQLDDVAMKSTALIWLQDRLDKLEAGRVIASSHRSVERTIQQVDPNLRLRWEFDHPEPSLYPNGLYAVDRWIAEYGYHYTIFFWSHTLGEGTAMRQVLRDGDMQSPDYHKRKRKQQEATLKANDDIRTNMALEAIDNLTLAQCKQFIEVETALSTGETIHVRGKDADIMNKLHENNKANPGYCPPSSAAINRDRFGYSKYRRRVRSDQR